MKLFNAIMIAVSVLLATGAGGYWLGTRTAPVPMAASSTKADTASRILYYRNPMGLQDTSPVPKKDSMGMDYLPVYEGEQEESGQLSISIEKVQKLGVKSEAATLRPLDKTIRAAGRIEIDERRNYIIAPKFEGWVERLHVNTTGQLVSKGQALFDVYSPELVSAQREYALATQGEASLSDADQDARNSMRQLAEASRMRLKNWGIEDAQISRTDGGNAKQNITFRAPVSGIVLEKKAVQGMRFMPGEVLYQIADLSTMWVVAEVAEQDIGAVKVGSVARITIEAYPEKDFKGKISFIYPTLNTATRTVQVRLEVANPKGLLKPAMFAGVELPVGNGGKVLTMPVSAVIDSGTRQVVLVQLAQGRFEPRTVRLGGRSENYVEVLDGIAEGEQVVISANFLIDAESNLKAALGGLSEPVRQAQDRHVAHGGNTPAAEQPEEDRAENTAPVQPKEKAKAVGHQGLGTLNAINADGTVSITHEPIVTLGWPGMTMDFALANSALVEGIPPGSAISFEIVERQPDEWVITRLQAKSAQHEGH